MNWPGRVVLLIAICVSLFLFWRKFGAALRTILASKPDADFQLRPIGPRIRRVLWEVFGQGLVIGQRPLPGLAHAFVFWGFCVFALVTVNHFAQGFRPGISVGRRLLAVLFSGCRRVRGGGGGVDRRTGLSPVCHPAKVA